MSPGAYAGFFDRTTSAMPYVEMMVPGVVAGKCECVTAGSYNPKRWYGSSERDRFSPAPRVVINALHPSQMASSPREKWCPNPVVRTRWGVYIDNLYVLIHGVSFSSPFVSCERMMDRQHL